MQNVVKSVRKNLGRGFKRRLLYKYFQLNPFLCSCKGSGRECFVPGFRKVIEIKFDERFQLVKMLHKDIFKIFPCLWKRMKQAISITLFVETLCGHTKIFFKILICLNFDQVTVILSNIYNDKTLVRHDIFRSFPVT